MARPVKTALWPRIRIWQFSSVDGLYASKLVLFTNALVLSFSYRLLQRSSRGIEVLVLKTKVNVTDLISRIV